MGQIRNKTSYPQDNQVTEEDYLIGTDGDSSNKRTKSYSMKSIADFIASQNNTISSDGNWVYRFNGDEAPEYGDFYTPGLDFNGGDDPNVSSLQEIVISNTCFEGIPAERLLNLAGQSGVCVFFQNKKDFNNYFLVKNPSLSALSALGQTRIQFTDKYWSKSFKKDDPYVIRFFFTSDFTPDLYRETNTSNTNNPTAPPNGGAHIGKGDKLRVLADKIEIDENFIFLLGSIFTDMESNLLPTDPDAIRLFRMICVNPAGRVFPLPFGDVQPNWTDENTNSRYHIKNRFPQKEINSTYTIQGSDNGHTIFVNNGTGNVSIWVNAILDNITPFRQCRIIQLGTGNVTIVGERNEENVTIINSSSGDGKIGGQFKSATLIRQVIEEVNSITYGEFYLLNGSEGGNVDWSTEDI